MSLKRFGILMVIATMFLSMNSVYAQSRTTHSGVVNRSSGVSLKNASTQPSLPNSKLYAFDVKNLHSHEWIKTRLQFNETAPLAVLLADGTWKRTRNGRIQTSAYSPLTITQVVNLSTSEVLNPCEVANGLRVVMLSSSNFYVGSMTLASCGHGGASLTYIAN